MDFGGAARDYALHRKGFPTSFFERFPLQGRVLDLGTGTGSLARGYAERAWTVGLDLSLPMLREAGAIPGRVAARAEALPFRSASFDAVTAGQCWHWFDGPAAARECLRVLRPGGTLAIAHFDYLADRPGVAAETERLILRFNPGWTMAGKAGIYDRWRPHLQRFVDVDSSWYDEPVAYSHAGWRGRMRACNGALAVPDAKARAQLDERVAEMLARDFPEPLMVPHRVFLLCARKPS
jgi:SAM-dependent methyltransferase